MKTYLFYLPVMLLVASLSACSVGNVRYSEETVKNDLRAPAYPLLMLHPHVRMWATSDRLTEKNMTFTNGKNLPFVGFLRVDGVMYRFMGSDELPMQAIAPMAYDYESWQGSYTMLRPDAGWEQPDFKEVYWQKGEGAFGTRDKRETKTLWTSNHIWVRRKLKDIDTYLLSNKKIYLRYSCDDALQLFINGKQLVDIEQPTVNRKVEVPDSILNTMKEGEALIAVHGENKGGSALVDFGLFAEEPEWLIESVAPVGTESAWNGRYVTEDPAEGWSTTAFDDSAWTQGIGAFGTEGEPRVATPWNTKRLWIRRNVEFDPSLLQSRQLCMRYSYNDGMQLLVNGKELVRTGTKARNDVKMQIPDSILETMKDGKALIAARCVNWGGTAFADFGLYGDMKEARQKSVDVQATQTHYLFDCGEVELKLTFTTPYLLDDLQMLSRPVNYISYQAKALDGKEHDVDIYFEMDPHKAFRAGQSTEMYEEEGWVMMKTGRENQKLWVDKWKDAPAWGYFYLGAKGGVSYAQGDAAEMRAHFMKMGNLKKMRRSSEKRYAALSQRVELNRKLPQHLTVAFDGLYTMAYFGENLRPYWNREGKVSIGELYEEAEQAYQATMARCYELDRQLMTMASRAGGKEYAELCAAAYRQAVSTFQLSENAENELIYFTTLVGSLDIYFSASPLFLCYNPALLKAMLEPFYDYSENGKWKKPFPTHDLGGYPFVNGQTKGGDYPVAHAAEMLIMAAALCKAEKEGTYAEKHWETLSRWADYLVEHGVDTDKQMDGDDFAGRYPHNVNLSVKGILGIASYALLAEMLDKPLEAKRYQTIARQLAEEWERLSTDDDGHSRLSFDCEDSWSLKYNLVWDRLLGLNVFPDEWIVREATFYKEKLKEYGCPLHSQTDYTKVDCQVWTAALAGDKESFCTFILPLYKYMNENKWRVPMADTYSVETLKTRTTSWGRPVVGAYFIKLLEDVLQ